MENNDQNQVDIEDIKAEVQKDQNLLFFATIVLVLCLIGFSVKTCTSMPPSPPIPDPSIECSKISGAHWVPTDYKLVAGYVQEIPGYCDTKKQ